MIDEPKTLADLTRSEYPEITANVLGAAPSQVVFTEALLAKAFEEMRVAAEGPGCGGGNSPHFVGGTAVREDWPYAMCCNCFGIVMLREPTADELAVFDLELRAAMLSEAKGRLDRARERRRLGLPKGDDDE